MINGLSPTRADLLNSLTPTQGVISTANEALATAINLAQQSAAPKNVSDEAIDTLLINQLTVELTLTKVAAVSSYQYSAQELAARTITSRQNEGLALNENSEQLLARLDQSAASIRTAYSNTSSILADLGQLGPQQRSFLASSEQRVERTLGSYDEKLYRHYNEDGDKNRFSISIETQEGDTITISLSSAQGNDEEMMQSVDSFQLAYEVDGDLSDEEHAALTKILGGIGELADDFFANPQQKDYSPAYTWAQPSANLNIDFLSDFDSQLLAGFDLSFSTSGGGGDNLTRNNLDLSYQFDHMAMTQQLAVDYESGMKQTEFSVDMSIIGQQDDQQLANYLAAMEQSFQANNNIEHKNEKTDSRMTMDKRHQQHASADFAMFKSAFNNMSSQANRYTQLATLATQQFDNGLELVSNLAKEVITKDPRYVDNISDNNQLGAGISQLADFSAQFKFKIGLTATTNNLSLSQTTSTTNSKDYQGVSQQKELQDSSTKKYGGDTIERANQLNYSVNAAIEGHSLVALDQQQSASSEFKRFDYVIDENDRIINILVDYSIEETQEQSSIRIVKDLWLQQNSSKQSQASSKILTQGFRQVGVSQQQSYSHQQLVQLIGDLTPLIDNEEAIKDLNKKLNDVNAFMEK